MYYNEDEKFIQALSLVKGGFMKALYKRGVYEVDKVGENSNLVQLNKDGVPLTVAEDQIDYLDN